MQLLEAGATYGHEYWDFPYEPDHYYSYLRHANAQGYATLNIDRLGVGASSHPVAEVTTTATHAQIHRLLVQRLKQGGFGQSFSRVVSVGHSYGSFIALAEAEAYRDVDALLLTGYSHAIGPGFVTDFLASLAPADILYKRFSNLLPGYLTSRPGTRNGFYHTPNADPAVVNKDVETKQTVTDVEGATSPLSYLDTKSVNVPIMDMRGQRDTLFCGLGYCGDPLSLTKQEKQFYPAAKSFVTDVIPGAGHDLNLHRNAPYTFSRMTNWIKSVIH